MEVKLKKYISKRRRTRLILILLVLGLIIGLGYFLGFDLVKLFTSREKMMHIVRRLLRPNFSYASEVFPRLVETIHMALIASLLGVGLSLPLSILVGKNINTNKFLNSLSNLIFVGLRTVPTIVWASILVAVFSVGPFAGTLGLTITALLYGLKLFKETIEEIDQKTIDSFISLGTSKFQLLRYCIIPSLFNNIISIFFMVLEVNIRSATVLGLVGAGGIGQIMWKDLNHLRYDNLASLIIILLITIYLVDLASYFGRLARDKYYIKAKTLKGFRMKKFFKLGIFILVLLISYSFLSNSSSLDFPRLKRGFGQLRIILGKMARIDLTYMKETGLAVIESMAIALMSTLLAMIISIFFTYLLIRKMNSNRFSYYFFKFINNIFRTFPSVILALIFFRGIGPGPVAGVLALTIYTSGNLSKMYGEAIEELDKKLIYSMEATGMRKWDVYSKGLVRESLGSFISLSIYRLESNMRNSTVLGMIGAGGVGSLLSININFRIWDRVGILLLGLFLSIILIEGLSSLVKKLIQIE